MSNNDEFNISKDQISSILQRLDEFLVGNQVIVFNLSNSPESANQENLTKFGITNSFGYKFEQKKPFPIGSILKVKCTTRDGQNFTVSETEVGDIRQADIFKLHIAIPELCGLGNRDIEILLEIKSKPNENGTVISNMNEYDAEMKAILGLETLTDMQNQNLQKG